MPARVSQLAALMHRDVTRGRLCRQREEVWPAWAPLSADGAGRPDTRSGVEPMSAVVSTAGLVLAGSETRFGSVGDARRGAEG